MFKEVKRASRVIAGISDELRGRVLRTLADRIVESMPEILEANACDMSRMDQGSPLCDRLLLTPARLESIAADLRHVSHMRSPVGEEMERRTLPSGLLLRKVRVPFGVVGIIYESRPNVTYDVFALCLKSGNACVLKGGKDAEQSNLVAVSLIREALATHGLPADAAMLLPSTHDAAEALLKAVGEVDLVIPRGGRKLIDYVRDNARVPVIETGAGVVHTYFDVDGDAAMGSRIIANAKTRRVSVCNALDTLLVHRGRLGSLPELVAPLAAERVMLHADRESLEALAGFYPQELLTEAVASDWDREWMDYAMGVRTVAGLDQAIEHIAHHGSGHSECIITESEDAARRFQMETDAACVYVNAPTSFTDGGQFGLGAEIGISTQKLGPRGPMGLEEITTYRYLIDGHGQLREK